MHVVQGKQHVVKIVAAEIFIVWAIKKFAFLNHEPLTSPVHVVDDHPNVIVVLIQLVKSDHMITVEKADETSFVDDALTCNVNLIIFLAPANLDMLHRKNLAVYFTRGLVHCAIRAYSKRRPGFENVVFRGILISDLNSIFNFVLDYFVVFKRSRAFNVSLYSL